MMPPRPMPMLSRTSELSMGGMGALLLGGGLEVLERPLRLEGGALVARAHFDERHLPGALPGGDVSVIDELPPGRTPVKTRVFNDEQGNPKPGKPGKWLNNAAYNAVLAYDEMVKDAEAKGP